MDFDFDYWSALAARNPVHFYAARRELLACFIEGHTPSEARRLWEFQSEIDHACALCGTPLRAVRDLMEMMDDRLLALRQQADALHGASHGLQKIVRSGRGD